MNYACFIISIFFLSIAVVMAVMAVLLNLKKPLEAEDGNSDFFDPLPIMLIILCLGIATISFSYIKTRIFYKKTQNYIVQENKDLSIPYKYKIKEITIKEYRDKTWITNDWKENSQQFEKEEKVIYSNDFPNGKYIFMEQEK